MTSIALSPLPRRPSVHARPARRPACCEGAQVRPPPGGLPQSVGGRVRQLINTPGGRAEAAQTSSFCTSRLLIAASVRGSRLKQLLSRLEGFCAPLPFVFIIWNAALGATRPFFWLIYLYRISQSVDTWGFNPVGAGRPAGRWQRLRVMPLTSTCCGPLSFSSFSKLLLPGTTACPRRPSGFLCSSCSMEHPGALGPSSGTARGAGTCLLPGARRAEPGTTRPVLTHVHAPLGTSARTGPPLRGRE